MSPVKQSAAPAMAGEGTEDSVLGTIVLLWGLFIVSLAEAGREIFSGGLEAISSGGAGPYFGLLGAAGLPLLIAFLALALGSIRAERFTRGVTVAAGCGLLALGMLAAFKYGWSPAAGRALIAVGLVVLAHFLVDAVRTRRVLPAGRFDLARTVLLGIWAAYAAATVSLAGSIHLGVLGLLAWQAVAPAADAYAALRERLAGSSVQEEGTFEEFVPVEVHSRFTPEQQKIVEGIVDFINTTYNDKQASDKWPSPTIREAIESPAFTTYILDKPAIVDASRFMSQVDNLAIELGVSEQGLDIVVSGKKRGLLVQIAKPREDRDILWFDEFTANFTPPPDRPFQVVLGEDSFGQPLFADIGSATEPHLLICGTTRSGKTIMMHNILCQLFIHNSPDDLQLAVIDPKMVSGQLYATAGAPHLWAPVVTESDMVPVLMKRVEDEMNKRYRLMQEANVTKISSYNRKHPEAKLPGLVFLMDEVASLTGDEGIRNSFEQHVGRIAMKGGAAGVFLVLGVQRPSQRNLSENVRGLLNQRIVFKLNSIGESTMALASAKDDPAAMRLGGSGDGYYVLSGERTRFIGAYLPEEEDRKWVSQTTSVLKTLKSKLAADQARAADAATLAADQQAVDFVSTRLAHGLTVESEIARIVEKWGQREMSQDLGPAPIDPVVMAAARAQLGSEHNAECTDREWLIITGLRLALASEADPYENRSFTPESLEPFVARAAEGYGYGEGDIEANEIHRALGRFFPDPRTGGPPRNRDWVFNRAMIEPSKYDAGLVGRFAADPASIPALPGVAIPAAEAVEGPSVEDIADRARRDF